MKAYNSKFQAAYVDFLFYQHYHLETFGPGSVYYFEIEGGHKKERGSHTVNMRTVFPVNADRSTEHASRYMHTQMSSSVIINTVQCTCLSIFHVRTEYFTLFPYRYQVQNLIAFRIRLLIFGPRNAHRLLNC